MGTDADVRSAFCRPAAKSFRFNTPFKIRGCRFPGKYVALDGTRNIMRTNATRSNVSPLPSYLNPKQMVMRNWNDGNF